MTATIAKTAPGTLEMREGIAYIVRQSMIDYCNDTLDEIEITLAEIPEVVARHFGEQAGPYLEEDTQRAILVEGFQAIEGKCYDISLDFYANSPILPAARTKAARANVEAIPNKDAFKQEINDISERVKTAKDLPFNLDLSKLIFEDGKLKVYPEAREGIAPLFTIRVEQSKLNTLQKIRQVAELVAELQKDGVKIMDEVRRGYDGTSLVIPGIVTRLASGKGYTDAEIISWLMGTPLPR